MFGEGLQCRFAGPWIKAPADHAHTTNQQTRSTQPSRVQHGALRRLLCIPKATLLPGNRHCWVCVDTSDW